MGYTKAGMLNYLRNHLSSLNILPALTVKSREFFSDPDSVTRSIIEFAQGAPIIVRSSSSEEDGMDYSNAGKYESILNVSPKSDAVMQAVKEVYASYATDLDEEILIQPMLQHIRRSGVVFTADMDTFADYYVVNYSDSDNSAAVTSGNSDGLKTYIKYKFSKFSDDDKSMEELFDACNSIEKLLGEDALDIEFAIDDKDKLYILQARPIAKGDKALYEKIDIGSSLERIYKKVKKLTVKHPFLIGDTTCFGVMPDWNPAEILGVRPKKLSVSLYKELVTDQIWAYQRRDYGYRDLTMHPLMILFCGVPYIDTRITFNSFVPQGLNEKIAEKLVNYYLDKLARYPSYHDKIEFEIVFSCYYLGLHEQLKELLEYGFNENEITRIEFSLLELTNKIIDPADGLYKKDIEKALILEKNYNIIVDSDISLVDKIYWLLEECKSYGTLPFAGVARAGFIAVQFLRSFVQSGIISNNEYDKYMNSLDTVNKRMNIDLKRYCVGELDKSIFLETYGHIRPGTYDIMSKRYDEAFDEYFGDGRCLDIKGEEKPFTFTEKQMFRIQEELEQNGLAVTADELMVFVRESIQGREHLKFVFTKSVSKILQLIEELGERAGVSKEDMAHLDISVVKQLYVDLYSGDIRTIFQENIEHNKKQYKSALELKLPSMIVKPEDVYAFYLLGGEPNFVTQKSVTADTGILGECENSLEGKVIFVRTADPGYDFLFSKGIGGLVTQFGGSNSHMAIRCAELGIPAVIGAGEKNYTEWSSFKRITVDCLKKQVIRIK